MNSNKRYTDATKKERSPARILGKHTADDVSVVDSKGNTDKRVIQKRENSRVRPTVFRTKSFQ